jgi:hypothetical protein
MICQTKNFSTHLVRVLIKLNDSMQYISPTYQRPSLLSGSREQVAGRRIGSNFIRAVPDNSEGRRWEVICNCHHPNLMTVGSG